VVYDNRKNSRVVLSCHHDIRDVVPRFKQNVERRQRIEAAVWQEVGRVGEKGSLLYSPGSLVK